MKKIIFGLMTLFISIFFLSTGCHAFFDYNNSPLGWDFYYHRFKIIGYPVYNTLLERYDFYDLDQNYCGSLSYNPVLGDWEYFGL